MGVIGDAMGYAAMAGLGLQFLWAVKSSVTYFLLPRAAAIEEFENAPFFAGVDRTLVKTIGDMVLSDYFSSKQFSIRAHVAISTVVAAGLLYQLVPFIRRKNIEAHRWVGRALLTLTFASLFQYLHLIVNFSFPSNYEKPIDYCILLGTIYFGAKGWMTAREKNIPAHRSNMIMFSAGFFNFGMRRLVLALGCSLAPVAELAKIGSVTDYVSKVFDPTIVTTFVLVYGVAGYNAYAPRLASGKAKK